MLALGTETALISFPVDQEGEAFRRDELVTSGLDKDVVQAVRGALQYSPLYEVLAIVGGVAEDNKFDLES